MSKKPILRHYVSELDQLLNQFDQRHPDLSRTQLKEKRKHQRIQHLRDYISHATDSVKKIWEGF